jgi:hypothetical protein
MAKPLRILTCVWGDHHVDLFIRGTLKSLSWPANREALDGSTWNVVTKSDYAARIKTAFEAVFPNVKLQLTIVPPTVKTGMGEVDSGLLDHSNLILMFLQAEIKACLETKSRFLLAPPDTIFSENSIPNLLLLGSGEGTCVAVPHPRVLPEIIDDIQSAHQTSEALVALALGKHAHQSWKAAEMGCDCQNSLIGGIAWRKLKTTYGNETLYAVQHRLPTVYLANFLPEDFAYFINQPSFGAYDHSWPGERLIRQERQRTVGSSDAAFICEVTEFDKNIPPWTAEMRSVLQNVPDAFYRDTLHACHNRLFVSVFRGR